MERNSIILKWGMIISLMLCLVLPVSGLFAVNAEAQFSDAGYSDRPATFRTTSLSSFDQQDKEGLGDKTPARDAFTYADDKSLTNACIDTGKDKADCLCVTRVLKYELSVREYKAATLIFSSRAKSSSTSQSAIRLMLEAQGYSDSEINGLSRLNTSLTNEPDFAARCAEALLYFNGKQTG